MDNYTLDKVTAYIILDIYGDTWKVAIYYSLVVVGRGDSNPEHGFSVRCLKD